VKSVSALWALADPRVAAQVEAAHTAAVTDTISWLERTAIYMRLGAGGLRQVDVTGLLAVAFTHRDSRNGDPDLRTHVAISNKVRTPDGRWRPARRGVGGVGAVQHPTGSPGEPLVEWAPWGSNPQPAD
jgi:conjugative relaxase-like TrwC/TraI family protein